MKRTCKILTILLALALVLSLAACGETGAGGNTDTDSGADNGGNAAAGGAGDGGQEDKTPVYPALELPDVSGLTLTEEEFSDFSFSYPADKWTSSDGQPVVMYLNETINDDSKVNMNINYETEMDQLSQSDLDEIHEALETQMPFMTANAAEFRTVGDITVMYIDMVVEDKEAYVNFIIENAGLDEETIQQIGGSEGILEIMPATNQLMIYAIKDGHLYSFTGIYFSDTQKNDLLELFASVLPTIEKL